MEKVTHDPVNRRIIAAAGPVSGPITIDVLGALCCACKRAWLMDGALNQLKFPSSAEGGTVLPSGRAAPRRFILADP